MSAEDRLTGRQPKAILTALQVLGVVARTGPGTTVRQICLECDLAPATAYRIVGLLVGEEYLVRLPDLSGLALGARMSDLWPPTTRPDHLDPRHHLDPSTSRTSALSTPVHGPPPQGER